MYWVWNERVEVTNAAVPVTERLLCGVVVCEKVEKKESDGSKLRMVGPNCVRTPPPELTPEPPVTVEPVEARLTPCRLTLTGPGWTPTPTLRSNPPAWARRRTSLASSGP